MVAVFLDDEDVQRLLPATEAVAGADAALGRIASGVVESPIPARLPVSTGELWSAACVDLELDLAGVDARTSTAAGGAVVMVVFGLGNGQLEAVIESAALRRLASGAAAAIAARHLARSDATSLGLIGCGGQAAGHLACLREVLPGLERVTAFCPDPVRLADFCRTHGCEPCQTNQEVAASDVVVTATTSVDPVLRGEWLADGALVCGAGATRPAAREFDNAVLLRASFVCCDSRAQAELLAGDLIDPVGQGVLDWLEVYELSAVVAGEVAGRAGAADVVVFKSTGLAALRLAMAGRVLELAREQGAGRPLPPRR